MGKRPHPHSYTGEWEYGRVVSGKARMMRENDVGDRVPHVRIAWEDWDGATWISVRQLESAPRR